jgi:hypothetical protein
VDPRLREGRLWECAGCGKQTSVTAGTIMHHSKLALTGSSNRLVILTPFG